MDERRQEEKFFIRFTVNRSQGTRLMHLLRREAALISDARDKEKFREIAYQLTVKGASPYRYKRRVRRPADNDEVAVQRVLSGDHPCPVLSLDDARHVFKIMSARGVSATIIAQRLYCDRATIVRWRREHRNGKW
jgi:hypothetical protein